jgi:hypothetical protein
MLISKCIHDSPPPKKQWPQMVNTRRYKAISAGARSYLHFHKRSARVAYPQGVFSVLFPPLTFPVLNREVVIVHRT